ncbi:MAG: hypothetical protein AAFX40_12535, partial [Cyanobacteria bacterium J06639_1]
MTSPGAAELDRILDLGFLEGSSNVHPGQGTANRRIFFRNAKLEFLWVCDEADVRSPAIARTRLWERSRSEHTGYSPFGICLRWSSSEKCKSLPFETWDFRPPYLPSSLKIDVASQTKPSEPMIFMTPFSKRPDALTGDRAQPLNHPNGCRTLTRVALAIPGSEPLSEAATVLAECADIHIHRHDRFSLDIECDRD